MTFHPAGSALIESLEARLLLAPLVPTSSEAATSGTLQQGSALSPLPPALVEQPVSSPAVRSLPLPSQMQAITRARADISRRSGLAAETFEVVDSTHVDGVYTVRLVNPSRFHGEYQFRRIGGKLTVVALTCDDRRNPIASTLTQAYFSHGADGSLSGRATRSLVRDLNLRPVSLATFSERLGPGGVVLSTRESGFRIIADGVRDDYSVRITYEQGAIKQRLTIHDYFDAQGAILSRKELTENFQQGVVRLSRELAETYGQVPMASITVNHVYDDRQVGTETTNITYHPGTRTPKQIAKSSWTRDAWGSWYYWYEVTVYDIDGNVVHTYPLR